MEKPNRRNFLKAATAVFLGLSLPKGLFSQEPQSTNQVDIYLFENDNESHPGYQQVNNRFKNIGIFIKTPLPLDGIEVIIETSPGRFTKIEKNTPGEARMDYSANLVKDTPFGGNISDLIKCLGYKDRFTDDGRVEMQKWPTTDNSRFYELSIEREPGTFLPKIYASAFLGNESLPVKVDSHVGEITKVERIKENAKVSFQNYPNPANLSTTVKYSAQRPSDAKLYIFDINGKSTQVIEQKSNIGDNYFHFDLNNYSSGAYFYRLELDGKVLANKKLMVVK